MTDHTVLIAKLKAATGPSMTLNADIAVAVEWAGQNQLERHGNSFYTEDQGHGPRTPDYLSSLDAALGTARTALEQMRMLNAARVIAAIAIHGARHPDQLPPVDFFDLCRAALLVRLGGE